MRSTAVLLLRHGKLFDHFLSIRIHETRLREFKSVSRGRGWGGGQISHSPVLRGFENFCDFVLSVWHDIYIPKNCSTSMDIFQEMGKTVLYHIVELTSSLRVALKNNFFLIIPCSAFSLVHWHLAILVLSRLSSGHFPPILNSQK